MHPIATASKARQGNTLLNLSQIPYLSFFHFDADHDVLYSFIFLLIELTQSDYCFWLTHTFPSLFFWIYLLKISSFNYLISMSL